MLAGRRREALAAVAAGRPELLDPIPADVTDEASVRALFATTVDRYGRVDLLFNNAGAGRRRRSTSTRRTSRPGTRWSPST